jgi:hypothetical protein
MELKPETIKTVDQAYRILGRNMTPAQRAEVFARLYVIAGAEGNTELEKAWHGSIGVYEYALYEKHGGKHIRAVRTAPMINREGGVVGAFTRLVMKKGGTEGWQDLIDAGLVKYSAEYIVRDFADFFPSEVVSTASARLDGVK